ncbi:ABC transporter ATP-binding protein [Nocardioides acrostichi]|uniref:ABC transporter ATP-binding protein n=1 Tax=Nocardioides acrostichi TaxID=2784339 RepID=A0A930V1E0_9ACTN|nr:ABC transporter ATP-binding protein [Nocardioides acrostichi]MBF4161972.1 ABC transporter ATP-binding protein [Nocardioides acrostichi]
MSDVVFDSVDKRFTQGQREIHALRECSLHIREGEFFSLLGPSGTGKTTLLNLVAGFDRATSGFVTVGGVPVCRPGPDRAVVFQAPTLMPWLTALDNVAAGLKHTGLSRQHRRERAAAQLAEVGLSDAAGRRPHQLSGGMQQRVGIARALAMRPAVLVMDEPFAALDAYVRQEAQALVVDLHRKHPVTTVFVTHSIEEALLLSDRIGVMAAGTVSHVYDVPFEHPRDATTPQFNDLRREIWSRIEAGVRLDREAAGWTA